DLAERRRLRSRVRGDLPAEQLFRDEQRRLEGPRGSASQQIQRLHAASLVHDGNAEALRNDAEQRGALYRFVAARACRELERVATVERSNAARPDPADESDLACCFTSGHLAPSDGWRKDTTIRRIAREH